MNKYFYQVDYNYVDKNNNSHYFDIGCFSTLKKAKNSIDQLRGKSGFCNSNGTFDISKFLVRFDKETNFNDTVYLYEVSHEYMDEEGYDNWIVFGVYATYEEAQAVQLEKSIQYPYSENPNGFCIATLEVDLCGWSEGFSQW